MHKAYVLVQCAVHDNEFFFAATTYPPSNCKSRLLSPSSLTIIQFFLWLGYDQMGPEGPSTKTTVT